MTTTSATLQSPRAPSKALGRAAPGIDIVRLGMFGLIGPGTIDGRGLDESPPRLSSLLTASHELR